MIVLTNVEVVRVADVDTSDTNTTKVSHRLDALVDDLGSVGLETSRQLDGVSPALGILASNTLNGNVRATAVAHFLKLPDNTLGALVLRKVHALDARIPLPDKVETPVLIDHDNTLRLVHQSELSAHLTNGPGAPDGNSIALLYSGVDNTVPARAQHVRKVQTLLIGNVVGKLEQVDVAVRHTSVFRLATSEATSEVRVSEHTSSTAAVHSVLHRVRVRALALRRLLPLAVVAVATGNLEASDYSVALLEILDASAHLIHNTTKLVAKDVALLQLDDGAMVQVKVTAADGAASDLEDYIAVFKKLWLRAFDYAR